jgi:hypothetical protein
MMEQTATFRGDEPATPPTPVHQLRLLYTAAHGVTASPAVIVGSPLMLGRASTAPELATTRDDKALSRNHAEVTVSGGVAQLIDSGSHNGSFVNGERVSMHTLRDGDIVRIGGSLLIYRFEPLTHCARDVSSGRSHCNDNPGSRGDRYG